MAAVDQNSVIARLLDIGSGNSKIIRDPVHIILCHGAHMDARQIHGLYRSDSFLLIVKKEPFPFRSVPVRPEQ